MKCLSLSHLKCIANVLLPFDRPVVPEEQTIAAVSFSPSILNGLHLDGNVLLEKNPLHLAKAYTKFISLPVSANKLSIESEPLLLPPIVNTLASLPNSCKHSLTNSQASMSQNISFGLVVVNICNSSNFLNCGSSVFTAQPMANEANQSALNDVNFLLKLQTLVLNCIPASEDFVRLELF